MTLEKAPLGHQTDYPEHYSPDVLFPVHRAENRSRLGLANGTWCWQGEDLWRGYELSWLHPSGLPQVALVTLRVPVHSPFLIESKSLKLYLNSFYQETVPSWSDLEARLVEDLSRVAGAAVDVVLQPVDRPQQLDGAPAGSRLLDDQSIEIHQYEPDAGLLRTVGDTKVEERLHSHLLRSRCPVTGQPDWGTLWLHYRGRALDHAGLLRYIVGFRQHQDFHEHCVERIFVDVLTHCEPSQLSVGACYTRRGGLDINPWRSTETGRAPDWRLVRQ